MISSLVIIQVKVKLRVQARIFGECRLHSITRLLGVIWSSEEAHTVDAWAVRGVTDVVACESFGESANRLLDPEISGMGDPT